VVLRQVYKAGEKCFVDYAGPTVPLVDPRTGAMRPAFVFVGGVPAVVVPDNPKTGVRTPSFYDPEWNPTVPGMRGA
jgi:transposase